MYDMPVVGVGKDKLIDGKTVYEWFKEWKPDLIVVEKVGARPGQGVVSMFTFGVSLGVVLGLATATNARLATIAPNTWKRKYGLIGKSKEAAVKEAYMLFPQARPLLTPKRGVTNKEQAVGRADALLLADYGARFV